MDLKPDILIVIECEGKATLAKTLKEYPVYDIQWYGENEYKGIAIVRMIEAKLSLFDHYSDEFKYIVPFNLCYQGKQVSLFVIWAMPNKKSRKEGYVGQIWKAINAYTHALQSPSILIGDFNSNAIWDDERKHGNHSMVVEYLKIYDIFSLYHAQREELHGEESEATWYMYRHEDKPYHLDYCFVSASLVYPETRINIGNFKEWIEFSDHMPLIVDDLDI